MAFYCFVEGGYTLLANACVGVWLLPRGALNVWKTVNEVIVVGALLGVWDDTHVVVGLYPVWLCRVVLNCWFGGFLVWVLCENWIVDASILFFCKFEK